MASEGQAKVSLLLELKNRMSTALTRAKENVNGSVAHMKGKFNELKLSHSKAFAGMKDEIPGLSSAMSLLSNPYALAAAAVVALGMAYYQCVNMALDWEKGLAKVNVTAQLSQKELAKLSDQLLDIGARNVAPLEQIPDAFNKIISAGLNVNDSLKALEPTLRAAKAGFTDIETTAAAAVGVMNSSGRDVNTVYDVLFATVNKGNAEFKDIAQYLPKVIPLARGAGLALEETAGAWAYFTAQGASSEQATTGMVNLTKVLSNADITLGKLNKKTGMYSDGLPSIGVNAFDAAGKMRPLKDIAFQLTGALSGLTDKQKMLKLEQAGIVDMEAKGAILSMTQNYSKLSETIDFVTKSQGSLNKAYTDSMTSTDKWAVIQNMLKAEMIKLGQYALPIINSIGEKILNVVQYFKDLYARSEMFRDIISGIGNILYTAFTISMMPLKTLWNMVVGYVNALTAVGNRIFSFAGGIEGMYSKIRPYLLWIFDLFSKIADIAYKVMTMDFSGAYDAAKNFKMPSMDDIKAKILVDNAEAAKKQDSPFSTEDAKTPNATPGNENNVLPISNPANALADKATQSKNITINIDSFVKGGINTEHTNLQNMDESQLEQWMTNMFMRVVRNAEMNF